MKKIGFIGIGIMGESMVRNLMKAGYEVAVYNRTKSKADAVVAEGALWCGLGMIRIRRDKARF